jgi:hypothetical protein
MESLFRDVLAKILKRPCLPKPETRKNVANSLFSLQIWETLGYQRHEDGRHFIPPDVSVPSNRALLLRAWVELSAWVAEYLRNHRMSSLCPVTLLTLPSKKHFGSERAESIGPTFVGQGAFCQ